MLVDQRRLSAHIHGIGKKVLSIPFVVVSFFLLM